MRDAPPRRFHACSRGYASDSGVGGRGGGATRALRARRRAAAARKRATQSCSGAMAAPWLQRRRVRSVRPACAGRRPRLHAGCRRSAPHSPAQERWRRGGRRRRRIRSVREPAPFAGLSYTQVGARARHTVLLRSDGSAVGCGDNGSGQRDVPAPIADISYTQVPPGRATQSRSGSMAVPWAAATTHSVSATFLRRSPASVHAGCRERATQSCSGATAAPWAAATTSSVSATCLRQSPTSATRSRRRSAPRSRAQERWRCRGLRRQRVRPVRPACAARRPQLHAGCRRSTPHSPAQERWQRRGLRRPLFGQIDLPVPNATSATRRLLPERATRTCSGVMAAP